MLKISYIAIETPIEKPKKLSQKDLIHKLAMETLELAKYEDRQKAKLMFKDEREYNEKLKIKRDDLNKSLNL